MVAISTGGSKRSGCAPIEFMNPARRCTAFGSARSPIRISGFSFWPVASNFFCASATMASTAARATASLSAMTMMPLLMSDGGRLKVAIGTSDSCASATTTLPESPSSAVRMMPSAPWAMQSLTCSSCRLASCPPLSSTTSTPASCSVLTMAAWPATQKPVDRSWNA